MNRRRLMLAGLAGAAASLAAPFAAAQPRKPTRLLLVHGRAQQGKDPVKLQAEWIEALNRGAAKSGQSLPAQVQVAFPYYGDLLDSYAQQESIPLTAEVQSRGEVNDEFLAFQAEIANEMRERKGITDAQIQDELGRDPTERGPQNWKWVQAILRAVDKNAGSLNQGALELFTRDVFLYIKRAGVRAEVDRVVARLLTDEPTVVVGHSLGSVVAYSVLRNDPRALQVPLYLTVGCPLAVRAIRDELRPLRYPDNVRDWYNAFDTRDVVALYPLDQRNFPVRPAVTNHPGVQNHTDNRHGIIGYLDDQAVAKRILDALPA